MPVMPAKLPACRTITASNQPPSLAACNCAKFATAGPCYCHHHQNLRRKRSAPNTRGISLGNTQNKSNVGWTSSSTCGSLTSDCVTGSYKRVSTMVTSATPCPSNKRLLAARASARHRQLCPRKSRSSSRIANKSALILSASANACPAAPSQTLWYATRASSFSVSAECVLSHQTERPDEQLYPRKQDLYHGPWYQFQHLAKSPAPHLLPDEREGSACNSETTG